MVRASLKVWSVLLVVPGTAACLGYELVAPGARDPGAQVRVVAVQTDSVLAVLDITLDAGTDSRGRPNALPDQTVLINGNPFLPVRPPVNGGYEYLATITLANETAHERLNVILPFAGAQAVDPVRLSIPFALRTDSADIILRPGQDAILSVSASGLADESRANWSVELRSSCYQGQRFGFVGSTGRPPDRIVIPYALFGSNPPSSFEICLTSDATFELDVSVTPNPVKLSVVSHAAWKVRVQATGRPPS